MKGHYNVHVLLTVHKLGGDEGEVTATPDDGNADELPPNSNVERTIATSVQKANCQCTAGARGGCHHVCMLLHLVRLLQVSTEELRH